MRGTVHSLEPLCAVFLCCSLCLGGWFSFHGDEPENAPSPPRLRAAIAFRELQVAPALTPPQRGRRRGLLVRKRSCSPFPVFDRRLGPPQDGMQGGAPKWLGQRR